jgi:hypothetical protein
LKARVDAPQRFKLSPEADDDSDGSWGPVDGTLTPCFVTRRLAANSRDELLSFSTSRAISFQEAQTLRERIVLVQLRADLRRTPEDICPYYQIDQCGAVISDFIIGRQEGCSLEVSTNSVSRSHCILQLRKTAREEDWKLVVFDDGSLAGTTHHGVSLGVGIGEAVEIQESDFLFLGPTVRIRLRKVSPVLRLDDHVGLAEFFKRTGELTDLAALQERSTRQA